MTDDVRKKAEEIAAGIAAADMKWVGDSESIIKKMMAECPSGTWQSKASVLITALNHEVLDGFKDKMKKARAISSLIGGLARTCNLSPTLASYAVFRALAQLLDFAVADEASIELDPENPAHRKLVEAIAGVMAKGDEPEGMITGKDGKPFVM